MISEITVSNFKSIENLDIKLGRVNIFIGENGAGKSNLLEAIALAGAAVSDKLDNEFLASRGIRVTKSELMRSAFEKDSLQGDIVIKIKNSDEQEVAFNLENDNLPYSKWRQRVRQNNINLNFDSFTSNLNSLIKSKSNDETTEKSIKEQIIEFSAQLAEDLKKAAEYAEINSKKKTTINIPPKNSLHMEFLDAILNPIKNSNFLENNLNNFIIYSPENSSLRIFEKESQIQPLGINGEGLLKLLHLHLTSESTEIADQIKESLKILSWFDDLEIPTEAKDERIIIKDRYIDENVLDFDQKSANEGFLFLLFYFTLFNSDLTPKFFAIDNIDASLNPKLCQHLIVELVKIAKKKNKQVILTTHNPAILDGLNLDDDEQRLFVVSRGKAGSTKVRRINKPSTPTTGIPYRLSELFLRGMLGGLPKGF